MTRLTDGTATNTQALEDLIAAAASGDREARNILLTHYWPRIERIVRGRMYRVGSLRGREDVVDLSQEVAMRILHDLHQHGWQGHKPFLAWMRKIADSTVIDRNRYHGAESRKPALEVDAEALGGLAQSATSAETRSDRERLLRSLRLHLDSLKPDLQAALLMHHSGYTYPEIADHLNLNAEQVRKQIKRAEHKLADALAMED